jgi:hypothetical protein
MLVLGGSAWWGSGQYLEQESRQQVADAWDTLRICLMGDGLAPGTRPSEHRRLILHSIAHTDDADEWPSRCLPYAERLDASLEARSVRSTLGSLPSAVEVVRSEAESLPELDALYGELERADLPLPKRDLTVPTAPGAIKPLLRAKDLGVIGKVVELDDIDVRIDEGRVLRLLIPESSPLVCRFNDGPRDQRWQTVACSEAPLTTDNDAHLRLSRAMPGAADLIYARDGAKRDGFYDAATGQRIWRPSYFDAQAYVRDSGTTSILYADMRDGSRLERVEQFRLLDLVPGKRPRSRSIRVPSDARVMLLADGVLWWSPESQRHDTLMMASRAEGKRPLAKAKRIGQIQAKSRRIDDCRSDDTLAVLFASGIKERRYALAFRKDDVWLPPLDVGVISGQLVLSCHDGAAMLTRRSGGHFSRWRCNAVRCVQTRTGGLPITKDTVVASASLGTDMALAWISPGQPLRLRIAEPDSLHAAADVLLFDDANHGGIEPTAMRMVSADGLAILLMQDEGRRVYALRIGGGKPQPVRIVR